MKPLLLALQFMTRLPLPAIAADEADFGRAIRWFPAAGLVVGSAVAAAAWAGLHRDTWLAALLALAAWIAITGALHLDGLGDIADAAGAAHHDPARVSGHEFINLAGFATGFHFEYGMGGNHVAAFAGH